MRYQDEPCCGCGRALDPQNDNVVVCPDCGAPMHRACWDTAAACPLREQHSPDFVWVPTIAPAPAPPAFDPKTQLGIICPHCGANCPPSQSRCLECGEEFGETERQHYAREERLQQEEAQQEQYFRDHFPSFQVNGRELRIGDNVAGRPMEEIVLQLRGSSRTVTHYLETFEKNHRLGWNWASFFFTPYWFFFRKLYRPALLFAGLVLALTLAFAPMTIAINQRMEPVWDEAYAAIYEESADPIDSFWSFWNAAKSIYIDYRWPLLVNYTLLFALHIAAGLFGDTLLRRKIFANIETANDGSHIGSAQRRHQLLIRLGGFSFLAPMLYAMADQFILTVISNLIL